MKKFLSTIIVCCMFLCCCVSPAHAMTYSVTSTRPVILEQTRNTITGEKSSYPSDGNGNTVCKATLTGSFTYNGTSSSCTGASCNVTIYNSSWSTKSVNAYTSGNSAIADVVMERKFLFITLETLNFSITLSCDRYGNLT